jgi:cystathionine beta-lyase family protein involved in aluminum resistance
MKLSRLFFKKLVLKHLYTYVMTKNHVLPKHYRIQKLKAVFLKTLTLQMKSKWNEKRSDIILRQLKTKRRERLLKLSFLKLLENVLKAK